MDNLKQVILGGGCFWCLEAVFQSIKGIEKVVSGYAGGKIKNPTYKEICSGLTDHAEVIQIMYNPDMIMYKDIIELFWHAHDPTTLNRQGNDVGTQYRSIILYENEEEKQTALTSKNQAEANKLWSNPIVTEINKLDTFYPAEVYHQNYYNLNKDKNPYCSIIIAPKIAKFRKEFAHLLKE